MKLNALIVDDDQFKLGKVREVLFASGIPPERVEYALNSVEAVDKLKNTRFDIMILDINLPRRLGESARRGGGMDVLDEIRRSDDIYPPRYIVGLTAYEDVIAEFGEQFIERLWTLVHYRENSDFWISQIKSKIEYVRAVRESDNFTDGRTYGMDIAIVCALESVELGAIKRLPCEWQPLRLPFDETRYISGTIKGVVRNYSLVAAAAPRMGMPASTALSAKMIASFRPKYLVMLGICAGRSSRVAIGDVIIANPMWDWGSGKIDAVENKPRFRPLPHHIELDIDLVEKLKPLCLDAPFLAGIKQRARGNKPQTELGAHVGPLASGAAVVANEEIFEGLLDQHRDILGLEMEAYGLAIAARSLGKPRPTALIMKSVCDFADKEKVDDFQEYAAETSALLFYEIFRQGLAS